MARKAGDGVDFGAAASEIARVLRLAEAAHEEARLYGCPEVGTLVRRKHERRIDGVLAAHGLTREEYNRLLAERTTPKFACFSGLSVDEHPLPCRP